MGMGSASSQANSAIDASGGQLTINKPNYAVYAVVALGLIIAAYVITNWRKR